MNEQGQVFRSRSPVRYCDLGGWTDTRIVKSGAVLNFAAALYTHVTLRIKPGRGSCTIQSHDTGEFARLSDIRQVEYDGVLDLFKAAIVDSRIGEWSRSRNIYGTRAKDIEISVRSDVPPASGLGSSAALAVSAVAVLAAARGVTLLPYETASHAQRLETEILRLECGVQDQLTSAYGGINFIEVDYPGARVHRLELPASVLYELEDRFVLVYTGKSHFSSNVHEQVISAYERGENRQYFSDLAMCARDGKNALLAGDISTFGAIMNENWRLQRALHPVITTPEIEELCDRVSGVGAIGFKGNGAAGGGTVTILAGTGSSGCAVRQVISDMGMLILPSKFDTRGCVVWQP